MPTTRRTGAALTRALFTLAAVAVVVIGVGLYFHKGIGPLPDPEGCAADVGGVSVLLSTEQGENAALISAVAVRRGLPARAVSIALATAFQESKLRNLTSGDRDSLGLFQQRPSQGWGTAAQITDPYYAANRFYDALQKIHGYQGMRITEAAQKVQRSAYPEAYEGHAADGRALASALTGFSATKFTCVVHAPATSAATSTLGGNGLTARADAVRQDLNKAFGHQPAGNLSKGGTGFDVQGTAGPRKRWAMASYLVAQAKRLDIAHISLDGRTWTRGSASEKGWRSASGSSRALHVDVLGGTG